MHEFEMQVNKSPFCMDIFGVFSGISCERPKEKEKQFKKTHVFSS